jgi:S1-C subfamily serine protease
MAKYVMEQLVQFGEVRRGTLGLFVQDLTGELAVALGVQVKGGALVAEVVEDSAASRGGIEPGDVIVRVSELAVGGAQDFHNIEGQLPIGESVEVTYLRDQKSQHVMLDVDALKQLDGGAIDGRLSGATFEDLPLTFRAERVQGVLLSDLQENSRLARQGLRRGDIITGVNRTRVSNLAQFQDAILLAGGQMVLQLRRDRSDYVARIE